MAKFLSECHQIMRLFGRRRQLPLVLSTVLLLSGCSNDEGIRVYRVAKSDQHRGLLSQNGAGAMGGPAMGGMPAAPAADAEPVEMLGALIPRGKSYWVFKLTDEPEVMEEYRDEYREIVKSFRIEDGAPTWELKEGWESKRSFGGIVYAELLKESAGLRATVTEMPLARDWRELVKENVGRWQGQLALEPAKDWDSVQDSLEEVAELSEGDSPAYFVSLVGKGSGQMRGPFQAMAGSSSAPMSAPKASSKPPAAGDSEQSDGHELKTVTRNETVTVERPAAKAGVQFEAPDAWQALDVSQSSMRLAAFRIEEGEQSAELTVIPARGSIDANLGMWFSQIKVQPDAEKVQSVQESATEVTVQGVDSRVYHLGGADSGEAILVADIPWRGDESLFVKLKGSEMLVAASRDDFMAFIESLTWPGSAAAMPEPGSATDDQRDVEQDPKIQTEPDADQGSDGSDDTSDDPSTPKEASAKEASAEQAGVDSPGKDAADESDGSNQDESSGT